MKKRITLLPLLILTGLVISCGNLQIPEKISIATGANYSFSMGEMSADEYLKNAFGYPEGSEGKVELFKVMSDKLSSGLGENSSIEVLDYNPKNAAVTCQQLAIRIPIQQFDVDFSSYLEQANLDGYLNAMSMDYDIDIPNFGNLSQSQSLPMDTFNSLLNKAIYVPVPWGEDNQCQVLIAGGSFDSISYSEGSLELRVYNISDFTGDELNADASVSPVSANVTIDGYPVQIKNGKGSYSLNNKSISKDGLTFKFISGSAPSGSVILCSINSNSKIKSVNKLNLDTPLDLSSEEISFDIGNESALKEMVIKTGSASAEFKIPDQWPGVGNTTTIELSSGLTKGGLPITLSDSDTDLAGASYKNGKIGITPKIKLSFTDANINFAYAPEFKFNLKVTELEKITIGFDTDLALEQSQSQKLPDDALNLLKKIKWGKTGITIKAENNLPEGNNIDVSLSSKFLGIAEKSQTIVSGSREEQTFEWNCDENHETIFEDGGDNITKFDSIDFTAKIDFPAETFDKVKKELTLKNVSLGESYKIKLTATPTIEWKEVTISNEQTSFSGSQEMEVNFNEIFSALKFGSLDLSKSLELSKLDLYLYCDIGELKTANVFDNPSIKGKIKLSPGKFTTVGDTKNFNPTAGKEIDLLGNSLSDGELAFNTAPVFEKNEDGSYKTVTDEFTSDIHQDLAGIINDLKSDTDSTGLGLNYDVKFTTGSDSARDEITIKWEKLKNLKKTNIDLSAIIVLPFSLQFTQKVESTNLLEDFGFVQNPDDDLLGRSSSSDFAEVKNYASLIKNCGIKVTDLEFPINVEKSMILSIGFTDGSGNKVGEDSKIKIGSATDPTSLSVKINPEDLLDTYPLKAKLALEIPENNSISLPRELSVKGKISLNIQLDEDKPITIWEKNATGSSN